MKGDLSQLFEENAGKYWERYTNTYIRLAAESKQEERSHRVLKLKKLAKRTKSENDQLAKYTSKSAPWLLNIQRIQRNHFSRFVYDYVCTQKFIISDWQRVCAELVRERAFYGPSADENIRWKLDFTEGRCRMRKKFCRVCNCVAFMLVKVHY